MNQDYLFEMEAYPVMKQQLNLSSVKDILAIMEEFKGLMPVTLGSALAGISSGRLTALADKKKIRSVRINGWRMVSVADCVNWGNSIHKAGRPCHKPELEIDDKNELLTEHIIVQSIKPSVLRPSQCAGVELKKKKHHEKNQ